MRFVKYILIWCFIPLCMQLHAADFETSQAKFTQGTEAYKNGNYEEALSYFLEVDSAANGFDINYNLGNTYFKLGQVPQAVLYYERALKHAPTNDDARHNLRLANEQIVDRIESIPKSKLKLWWQDFKYSIGPDGWAWICIGLAGICVALALIYFLSGRKSLRRIGFFGTLFCLVLTVFAYVLASQADTYLNTPNSAIVFTDKVDVRSEPRNGSTQVFVLHAGTKVKLISSDGAWYNVEIASGNKGWVEAADVEEI